VLAQVSGAASSGIQLLGNALDSSQKLLEFGDGATQNAARVY